MSENRFYRRGGSNFTKNNPPIHPKISIPIGVVNKMKDLLKPVKACYC